MVEMAALHQADPVDRAARPDRLRPAPVHAAGRPRPLFQRLPEKQQAVFVQLMTMSAADFLAQWFETDPLMRTMSASGIIGTYQGVKSPGTAYVLLHHMGEIDGAFRAWAAPQRDRRRLGHRQRGPRPGCRHPARGAGRRIMTRDGRAVGVALESGEEIYAHHFLVGRLTPEPTLACSTGSLDPESRRRSAGSSSRGSSGKVGSRSTGCPTSPACRARAKHLRGAISVQPVDRRHEARATTTRSMAARPGTSRTST